MSEKEDYIMKRFSTIYITLLFLPVLLLFAAPGFSISEKSQSDDKVAIAGRQKAKEIECNPVIVYANKEGRIVVIPGSVLTFSTKKGWMGVVDRDMVINAGDSDVKLDGLTIVIFKVGAGPMGKGKLDVPFELTYGGMQEASVDQIIILKKGEYAVVKDGKFEKGPKKLIDN
jgi:hypothetical protein